MKFLQPRQTQNPLAIHAKHQALELLLLRLKAVHKRGTDVRSLHSA